MAQESMYDVRVFRCLEDALREPSLQASLPNAIRGVAMRTSSLERMIMQAATGMISVWEACLMARALSIVMAMNGIENIRSSFDLRRYMRAWML